MNTDWILDEETGEYHNPETLETEIQGYDPFMDSDDEEVWEQVMLHGIDTEEYDPLAHR